MNDYRSDLWCRNRTTENFAAIEVHVKPIQTNIDKQLYKRTMQKYMLDVETVLID
jgi:hypothetical protein